MPTSTRNSPWKIGWVALVFVLAASIAFGPSIAAPFDSDDGPAIVHNASIRQLWPPSVPLSPPGLGTAASGRPVANYSFALSYAIGRMFDESESSPSGASRAGAAGARGAAGDPTSTVAFHAVNIGLHVLAALLLFAIVRRTLWFGTVANEWRASADWIGGIVAGVWLLHPIQTEAVDYLSQRTELLVSVCYLATLYAATRAWWGSRASRSKAPSRERPAAWLAASVLACLVGMGSKEVMLTAPLVVLLYDRAFVSSDWRSMWADARRRAFYAALFATTALCLALVLHGGRAKTVGFDVGMPWYEYLYSQGWAIARYLQLILWPDRLTYNYGRDPVRDLSAVPGMLLLSALGVATVIAWTRDRWRWAGFVGAFFFLLLAPSSSVVPIVTEIAAERRVYLASAAVILLIVIGVESLRRRLASSKPGAATTRQQTLIRRSLFVAVGVAYFGLCTWTATRVAPDLAIMRWGVRAVVAAIAIGFAYMLVFSRAPRVRSGAIAAVLAALMVATFQRSALYADPAALWRDVVRKRPTAADAFIAVAMADMRATPPNLVEADSLLRHAIDLDSTNAWGRTGRAAIAVKQSRMVDAESLLVHAIKISPLDSSATDKMGQLLLALDRAPEAIPYLAKVARAFPGVDSFKSLGLAYLVSGKLDSAVVTLRLALQMDSTNQEVLHALGGAYVESGRGVEAIPVLTRAVAADPSAADLLAMTSLAYAEANRNDDAERYASAAISRGRDDPAVDLFAGRALQLTGRLSDAAQLFTRAAQLAPGDPQAVTRLAIVRAEMGDRAEAVRLLQLVLSRVPGYPPARLALARLQRPGAS